MNEENGDRKQTSAFFTPTNRFGLIHQVYDDILSFASL